MELRGPVEKDPSEEPHSMVLHSVSGPKGLAGALQRRLWWLIGLGTLFLILGAGNLMVGTKRAEHYRDLIRESHSRDSLQNRVTVDVAPDNQDTQETDLDEIVVEGEPGDESLVVLSQNSGLALHSGTRTIGPLREEAEPSPEYMESLHQRHDYYQLCILGSKYFLALSALLFLAALISLRRLRALTRIIP